MPPKEQRWVKYRDATTSKEFYRCSQTGTNQWDQPDGYASSGSSGSSFVSSRSGSFHEAETVSQIEERVRRQVQEEMRAEMQMLVKEELAKHLSANAPTDTEASSTIAKVGSALESEESNVQVIAALEDGVDVEPEQLQQVSSSSSSCGGSGSGSGMFAQSSKLLRCDECSSQAGEVYKVFMHCL